MRDISAGFPPYIFSKAQAARESNTGGASDIHFDRYSFRYEPCTSDRHLHSDVGTVRQSTVRLYSYRYEPCTIDLDLHDRGITARSPYSGYLFDDAKRTEHSVPNS